MRLTCEDWTVTKSSFESLPSEEDPCFGRLHSKASSECKICLAPVIYEGRLFLMNEICEARTHGAQDPSQLLKLTSRDILQRLEAGQSVQAIFEEILKDNDPHTMGTLARNLIAGRFQYIQNELGVPVPKLPRAKALASNVRRKP